MNKNKINLSGTEQKLWEWENQQFGVFLKRKNSLAGSTPKGLKDYENKEDDHRILSWVKKNPVTTWRRVKNTLGEVGVKSHSTITKRLHASKYRGFTTRCKSVVAFMNLKARLYFPENFKVNK